MSIRGAWKHRQNILLEGSFLKVLARIYTSFGENHGKYRTARSTSVPGNRTRHPSTSFWGWGQGRTARHPCLTMDSNPEPQVQQPASLTTAPFRRRIVQVRDKVILIKISFHYFPESDFFVRSPCIKFINWKVFNFRVITSLQKKKKLQFSILKIERVILNWKLNAVLEDHISK